VLTSDASPLNRHAGIAQNIVTYTLENPTPALLNLDVRFESSDECAFAGPATFRLTLLAFTSHSLRLIVTPLKEEWALLPRIFVLDDERKRYLEILRVTDDLKVEGQEMFMRVPAFP
jgi:Gryzun, putative trafficking through Golgi